MCKSHFLHTEPRPNGSAVVGVDIRALLSVPVLYQSDRCGQERAMGEPLGKGPSSISQLGRCRQDLSVSFGIWNKSVSPAVGTFAGFELTCDFNHTILGSGGCAVNELRRISSPPSPLPIAPSAQRRSSFVQLPTASAFPRWERPSTLLRRLLWFLDCFATRNGFYPATAATIADPRVPRGPGGVCERRSQDSDTENKPPHHSDVCRACR